MQRQLCRHVYHSRPGEGNPRLRTIWYSSAAGRRATPVLHTQRVVTRAIKDVARAINDITRAIKSSIVIRRVLGFPPRLRARAPIVRARHVRMYGLTRHLPYMGSHGTCRIWA